MTLLNPSEANLATSTWTPTTPVPKRIRDWGYCADFSTWLPGDLILVSAVKPTLVGNAIRHIQEQNYAKTHAQWEHAAVYLGSTAICEATRKGVVVDSIYKYIPNHLIKVKRNPSLTNNQQWDLAINALMLKDHSYGFSSILELLWKANRIGRWGCGTTMYSKRTRICSELYADAHAKSSGIVVGYSSSGLPPTPASLSIEPKLIDIDTQWVKII